VDPTEKSLYESQNADSEENMGTLFSASSQTAEDFSTPWDVLIGFFPSVEDEFTLKEPLHVSTFAPAHRSAGRWDSEHPETFPAAPVCFSSCCDMPGRPAQRAAFCLRGEGPACVAVFAEIGPASRLRPFGPWAAAGRRVCIVMGRWGVVGGD